MTPAADFPERRWFSAPWPAPRLSVAPTRLACVRRGRAHLGRSPGRARRLDGLPPRRPDGRAALCCADRIVRLASCCAVRAVRTASCWARRVVREASLRVVCAAFRARQAIDGLPAVSPTAISSPPSIETFFRKWIRCWALAAVPLLFPEPVARRRGRHQRRRQGQRGQPGQPAQGQQRAGHHLDRAVQPHHVLGLGRDGREPLAQRREPPARPARPPAPGAGRCSYPCTM